jgi:mannose-6-phosphate isomerase-like protein (cupin superfamily)
VIFRHDPRKLAYHVPSAGARDLLREKTNGRDHKRQRDECPVDPRPDRVRYRPADQEKILYTERVVSDLLCYEPGQGTVIHHYNTDDEAFYVIEGRGTVSVDEEVYEVGPTSLVFAPMGKEHGIEAASDSRLVIIYFRSPGRKTSRPGLQPNLDG